MPNGTFLPQGHVCNINCAAKTRSWPLRSDQLSSTWIATKSGMLGLCECHLRTHFNLLILPGAHSLLSTLINIFHTWGEGRPTNSRCLPPTVLVEKNRVDIVRADKWTLPSVLAVKFKGNCNRRRRMAYVRYTDHRQRIWVLLYNMIAIVW